MHECKSFSWNVVLLIVKRNHCTYIEIFFKSGKTSLDDQTNHKLHIYQYHIHTFIWCSSLAFSYFCFVWTKLGFCACNFHGIIGKNRIMKLELWWNVMKTRNRNMIWYKSCGDLNGRPNSLIWPWSLFLTDRKT